VQGKGVGRGKHIAQPAPACMACVTGRFLAPHDHRMLFEENSMASGRNRICLPGRDKDIVNGLGNLAE